MAMDSHRHVAINFFIYMEYQDNCAITVVLGSGAYMDSGDGFIQIHIIIQLQMDWRIECRYLKCQNIDILKKYTLQDMIKSTHASIWRAIPRSIFRLFENKIRFGRKI